MTGKEIVMFGIVVALLCVIVILSGNAEAKDPEWTLDSSAGGNEDVDMSDDGAWIVIAKGDDMYLYGKDGSQKWKYDGDSNKVRIREVAISRDGEYIVAGCNPSTGYPEIMFFEDDSNTPKWTNSDPTSEIKNVAISTDGSYCAAATYNDEAILYRFTSGGNKVYETEEEYSYETIYDIDISGNSNNIVVADGGNQHYIYRYRGSDNSPDDEYQCDDSQWSIAISKNDNFFVSGGQDQTARLFETTSSSPYRTKALSDTIYSVAIADNGEYYAVGTGGDDKKVYLFDKDVTNPLWSYQTGGIVRDVAISGDGNYVAVVDEDGKNVYFFERSSGDLLWNYTTSSNSWAVELSQNGDYLVVGCLDHTYLFYNGDEPPTAYIDSISPKPADKGETVRFRGHGTDSDGTVEKWEWSSSRDDVFSTSEDADYSDLSVGTHTISYRVKDDADQWSEFVTDTLRINDKPTATISSISPSPADEGDEVTFEGTGSDNDGSIDRYVWKSNIDGEFYNGTQDNVKNSDLSVGTHTITFLVMDNDDAWSTDDTKSLTVNNVKPTAAIDSITPSSADEGQTVQLRGSGSDAKGTIEAYEWSSDKDDVFSTEEDPDYDGLSVNTHTISFSVQDDEGTWSDPDTKTLTINNVKPTAAIDSITPSPTDEGQTVQFRGSGSDAKGTIEAYEWSSDKDDVFSTEEDPDYDGLSVNTHTISFRVQDDEGTWSDAATKSLTVNNVKPTAAIDSITPSPANETQIVNFKGSGNDVKGTIVAYKWESDNDGALSIENDFLCNNLTIGIHTIYFSVQDDESQWSTKSTTYLEIKEIPNTPPTINLNAPTDGATLTSLQPTLRWSSGDNDTGDLLNFDVYMDNAPNLSSLIADGIAQKSLTTENLSEGVTYYWQVVVSDGTDVIESDIWSFYINKKPLASINADSTSIEEGEKVTFDAGNSTDSDGEVAEYYFDFGDGSDSGWIPSSTIEHTYTEKGEYEATVKVRDNSSAESTNTAKVPIQVVSPPHDDDNELFGLSLPIAIGFVVLIVIIGIIGVTFVMSYKIKRL